MSVIRRVRAREVLDSRGWPTVEVDVVLEDGSLGRASVPTGASVGKHEACVLTDRNKYRYGGRGVAEDVLARVRDVIAPALVGMDASEQSLVDRTLCELDGTSNRSRLGANNILAVSLATAQAQSRSLGIPLFRYVGGSQACILPTPMINVINGGMHASNALSIQEFMIMPVGAERFSEAVRIGSEIFHHLGSSLRDRGYGTAVGDEGGFAPSMIDTRSAIELILGAIERGGYEAGRDVVLALDAAASSFYDAETGGYRLADYGLVEGPALVEFWKDLVACYPIASLEDPVAEEDTEGWISLTRELGGDIQIVGDDVFASQEERLRQGVKNGVANAILVKPNQVGTLSETFETVSCAQLSGYRCIFSHRSGETEDTSLADLAVASGCGQIKTGSLSRSERLCKYNQLLRLEEQLGSGAVYAGRRYLASCRA